MLAEDTAQTPPHSNPCFHLKSVFSALSPIFPPKAWVEVIVLFFFFAVHVITLQGFCAPEDMRFRKKPGSTGR